MKANDIKAKTKKKYKVTTNSDHLYQISPNLLEQNFQATSVNSIWVSDITYIKTFEGWLYLTIVLVIFTAEKLWAGLWVTG